MQICGWYLEQLVGHPNGVDCNHFDIDADVGVTTESMSVGGKPVLGFGNRMSFGFLVRGTTAVDCDLLCRAFAHSPAEPFQDLLFYTIKLDHFVKNHFSALYTF